jgi:hypothetical protein
MGSIGKNASSLRKGVEDISKRGLTLMNVFPNVQPISGMAKDDGQKTYEPDPFQLPMLTHQQEHAKAGIVVHERADAVSQDQVRRQLVHVGLT